MTERIRWEAAREVIEEAVGPVLTARPVEIGFNSEIAVVVNDRYFVKGLRKNHPRAWTQDREKAINPHIRHLSASLEWDAVADGWNVLGFEYLPGRHADYRSGSPDIPLIIDMISRIPTAPVGVVLRQAEQRWSRYSAQSALFAGNHLAHTDWSPSNILIADCPRLVDWAWPTRGAAWIDPACLVVWLIAFGHTPVQAESHAARLPAFAQAPESAVTAFSAAQAAMWNDLADHAPHPALAEAAAAWHQHREHS